MLEDKLLVLKCRRGSKDAMCRIYEKYKDYLLTVAKGLLSEQATAEDVVHDVFLRFAGSAKQFELKGSLKGYLATCAANLARDRIRARKQRGENPDPANLITAGSDNPEQHVIEREELTRLRQCISQLPYSQREAITLHLQGGMKFRQIAECGIFDKQKSGP